jgi:hypothetical protein
MPGVARHVIGCHLTQETRIQSALGLAGVAGHVIGCHLTQETRVQSAVGPGGCCSSRDRVPFDSSEKGSERHRVPCDLRGEGSECVGRRVLLATS